jgi:preprotein translocase subunit SecG
MGFIIGFLTLIMVLDCIVLILLVLIQLPKKEAGAGIAFGGSTADALFGAGSGTVLTKITKYTATAFFIMALLLSILQSNYHRRAGSQFQKKLEQTGPAPLALPPAATAPSRQTNAASNTLNKLTIPQAESTNTPQVSIPSNQAAPSAPASPNTPAPKN